MRYFLVIAVLTCLAVPAFAEEKEQPSLLEDFFLTESVYPQGRGETQFTLGADYSAAAAGKELTLAADLEYGITDQWQVEVGWDAFRQLEPDAGSGASGLGNLSLGGKYTFEPCPTTGVQLAVGLEVTLPTGSEKVSENVYVSEPYLVLSRDLGENANLHASVAYGIVSPAENGVDGNDEIAVSLGGVYRFDEDWRLTLETYLESSKIDNGDETEHYLAPGLLWKGMENVECGFAVAVGLNDDSADWRLLGMVSLEF